MANDIQERLKQLELQVSELKVYQTLLERILQTQGISGPWVTIGVAAPLLCVSESSLRQEINLAESARACKKRSDCQYGVHYRNLQSPGAGRPQWQIHLSKFEELLAIPPDQRRVA